MALLQGNHIVLPTTMQRYQEPSTIVYIIKKSFAKLGVRLQKGHGRLGATNCEGGGAALCYCMMASNVLNWGYRVASAPAMTRHKLGVHAVQRYSVTVARPQNPFPVQCVACMWVRKQCWGR